MICWFEHGVTDSFGPELAPMECLGLLAGSACPHYDGEERRGPVYTQLVQKVSRRPVSLRTTTSPCTSSAANSEVVTSREDATAFRVEPTGEERLEARLLAKAQ